MVGVVAVGAWKSVAAVSRSAAMASALSRRGDYVFNKPCVRIPRRGCGHRTKLPCYATTMGWLTEHWVLALLIALCVYFLIAIYTTLVGLRNQVGQIQATLLQGRKAPNEDD